MKKWKWAISLVLSMIVWISVGSTGVATANGTQVVSGISIYYGIKAGDTLYGISKRHYLTGDYVSVAKANGLDPQAKLKAGSRVKLGNPLVLDYYTVAAGDTLYAIAGKYFSRINYISIMMQYNGMSSTGDLKAGMALRIPLPAGERWHKVQAGETLFSISSNYYKQVDYIEAIAKSNNIDSAKGSIKLGQSLLIPNPFYTNELAAVSSTPVSSASIVRSVEIDISKNKLYIKANGKLEKTFTVASGQGHKTPTGSFEIITKLKNPWYSAKSIPGGSADNPLGSRWLGLSVPGTSGTKYGIHGTNAPESIGTSVSAGCIRMLNKDVEWLYSNLPTGTKVLIRAS
ncbi:L,D-transpeptidase family protein [Paenibacillus sp. strain BS8-2]